MFSQRGEVEAALTRGALHMLAAFEELLLFLAQPASAAVRCVPSPLLPHAVWRVLCYGMLITFLC